jgi:hypothetical protein
MMMEISTLNKHGLPPNRTICCPNRHTLPHPQTNIPINHLYHHQTIHTTSIATTIHTPNFPIHRITSPIFHLTKTHTEKNHILPIPFTPTTSIPILSTVTNHPQTTITINTYSSNKKLLLGAQRYNSLSLMEKTLMAGYEKLRNI